MPADLVGTRIYRADTGGFDTELGPVFCNFLLADEINRAPAKVQSALLEVMQERQVTIGHESHRVPPPFLVMATQNPIESEGTYPLPEAQVDRFMFKLVVDYPEARDEVAVVERSLERGRRVRQVLTPAVARHAPAHRRDVYVDRRVMEYAVALTTATRDRGEHGWVEFGATPRGSINLVHAAARSRSCARATTCCRPTCATSRATCSATASSSPTRRSPPASTPTACSTTCCADADAADRAGRRRRTRHVPTELPRAPAAGRARARPPGAAAYSAAQHAGGASRPLHDVDLLRPSAGQGPRTRHVPALLALLALAALPISLARPERTVAAEQREGT